MIKRKSHNYPCHCDFCQMDDADEIRKTTLHLPPNYSVTLVGYPKGNQYDHLEKHYKQQQQHTHKKIKERVCASCEENWGIFVDWINKFF